MKKKVAIIPPNGSSQNVALALTVGLPLPKNEEICSVVETLVGLATDRNIIAAVTPGVVDRWRAEQMDIVEVAQWMGREARISALWNDHILPVLLTATARDGHTLRYKLEMSRMQG